MFTLENRKKKWFLALDCPDTPLNRRHYETRLYNWTDGNKAEMLIDGGSMMKYFHDCLEKMIRFMDENKDTSAPPQIWISTDSFSNIHLTGPDQGEKLHDLVLKATQKGIKIYVLFSGHFFNRIWLFGKLWEMKLKRFFKRLNKQRLSFASIDSRMPLRAVQHQKFFVCLWPNPKDWTAVVSSLSFNEDRWDTPEHSAVDKPSHDVSIIVSGPAVRDIALTFAERWNDPVNISRTKPQIKTSIPIDFLNAAKSRSNEGDNSMQVLRTYPIYLKRKKKSRFPPVSRGYAWSHQGEFTVLGAYLQAIREAKTYIYIEDQYFCSHTALATREEQMTAICRMDPVFELSNALKRGVDVIILLPEEHEEEWGFDKVINRQKLLTINYLYNECQSARSIALHPGRLIIRTLAVKNKPVIIHSKIMIVDDEFALLGSANIGNRSMTFDSEIHLGITSKDGTFAKELRSALWKEHLQLTDDESDSNAPNSLINLIKDPKKGIEILNSNDGPGSRRLRPIKINNFRNYRSSFFQRILGNFITQPYGGPGKGAFPGFPGQPLD